MARPFLSHPITDDSALGGAVIENSLRIRHTGISAKMYRTGNTTSSSYTFSLWFKYTGHNNNTYNALLCFPNAGTNASVVIDNNHKMYFDRGNGGSRYVPVRFFRDPGAWYHLTYSVNSNNFNAYINGESYQTGTVRSLDTSAQGIRIGILYDNYYSWEGYIADVHLVTDQALSPTDFAYTDTMTGLWRPKKYEGTYGTGGSHLEFKDNSSTSAMGKDTSGNGNDFTLVNFDTRDRMKDTPSNSFCIGNSINKGYYLGIQKGALRFAGGSSNGTVTGTIGVDPNRNKNGYYWELRVTGTQSNNRGFYGIAQDVNIGNGQVARGGDTKSWVLRNGDGSLLHNGSSASDTGVLSPNDKIMIAVKGNSIWWGKNGTWFNSGNPATGTNPAYTNVNVPWVPAIDLMTNVVSVFNFGQDSSFDGAETAQTNKDASGLGTFFYAVPSGFKALCTQNVTIESSTIYNAKKHFDVLTWTGNGSNGNVITGLEFQPDFIWGKCRSNGHDNQIIDSIRGTTKYLSSNRTDIATASDRITSINNNGFTLGSDARLNENSQTNVAWCWKAGGTAVSNTDGTITSSVSANKEAGFSIVSYTGNEVNNATVGHGLGASPDVVMIKDRDTNSAGNNWYVFHSALASGHYVKLNQTSASAAVSGTSNGGVGSVTSTTFNFIQGTSGNNKNTNENGDRFIAYCWRSIPGYSKFGSYVGSGQSPGTFLDLGFKPAMIIVKRNATEDWVLVDFRRTSNDGGNPRQDYLRPSATNTEGSGVVYDLTSHGVRFNNTSQNENGSTYYYLAWADEVGTTPFGSQVTAG